MIHAVFRDLPQFLLRGDCLVLNDTRVVAARFMLRRATGGRIAGLFLSEIAAGRWRALLQNAGRLRSGERLSFPNERLSAVVGPRDGEVWTLEIDPPGPAEQVLAAVGSAPLPPYIRRPGDLARSEMLRDRLDYQTVYAARPGAVAAPTAGLHFTERLLDEARAAGVQTAAVTLHVGLGTFQPVATADLGDHRMHAEWYEVSADAAGRINAARTAGGRIVAVGTTSVRVLETAAAQDGAIRSGSGWTTLLIQPSYQFRAVTALLTNFHLPRTTLLALVYAFAGPDVARRAYRAAIDEGYRFYSFGDAMLIV